MKQLFFICLLHFLSAQSFREFTEAKLREFYPNAIEISFKSFSIPKIIKSDIEQAVQQAFFRSNLYTWKITTVDSNVCFAVLDNVLGKVQPITFLVVFSKTHTIEFVEILKYREAYGGEISRQSFLDQFSGATDKSELKKGDDIKNISGATISVNALTRGVKKLNLLFPTIKEAYVRF